MHYNHNQNKLHRLENRISHHNVLSIYRIRIASFYNIIFKQVFESFQKKLICYFLVHLEASS